MYPQILGYLFGSFTVKHGSFPDLPQIHPSWIQAESGAVRGALWSRRDSIAVRDGSFVTYEIPIWLEEEGHPASSSYFRLGYQGFDSWLNLNHILFGVIKMDASAAIPITPGNALTNDCWEWFNGDRWLVCWYLVICKWDTCLGSSQQIRNMTLFDLHNPMGSRFQTFPFELAIFRQSHIILLAVYTHIYGQQVFQDA